MDKNIFKAFTQILLCFCSGSAPTCEGACRCQGAGRAGPRQEGAELGIAAMRSLGPWAGMGGGWAGTVTAPRGPDIWNYTETAI